MTIKEFRRIPRPVKCSGFQENAKEIKNKLEIEKAEKIVQEDLRNTYAQKQQLLTAMGKVIKNTAGDTSELQQKYAELNQELKDFDASLGKAGQLKDAIGDAGEEINRFASDTKRLDDVINIAQSATAAFGLYKGAMSALGIESEATEKAIQKLAGAMTVIQSLKQLSETLKNGSMTAKLFNSSLGLLTKGMQGASIGAKALRIALASIGIGLIISVVSALIEKWDDLVEWFQKTFPILGKLGSVFKGIVSVFVEFGKAIVKWVVTPIETVIGVISDLIHLDFSGAFQRVADGVKGIFSSAEEAAKEAQREMEERIDGYVDAAKRTAAALTNALNEEEHKQTEHQLNMLKARQGNEARYSEEGIKLQKKSFAERKKLAKDNADELRKIEIDEANFYRECEEYKTQQAQKGANERAAAARSAAKAAEDAARAAEEAEAKRRERIINTLSEQNSYRVQYLETLLAINKQEQVLAKEEVEKYKTGPIEKYVEALQKLEKLQTAGEGTARQIEYTKALASEWTDFCNIMGEENADMLKEMESQWDAWIEKVTNVYQTAGVGYEGMLDRLKTMTINGVKVTEEQAIQIVTLLEKHYGTVLQYNNDVENAARKTSTTIEKVYHDEFIKTKDNAIAAIENVLKKVENIDTHGTSWIFNRIFNKKETKKLEENFKETWKTVADVLDEQLFNMQQSWTLYLNELKEKYGEDSKEYIEEQRKMTEALIKYQKIREQATKNSKGVSSSSNMGALNKSSKKGKSPINKNETKTNDNGTTNWDSLWDGEQEVFENLEELADVFFENVFDPIAEAFSALLEFQIEEAQEALDKATAMHDKSVEQVAASNQRLAEIKNEMAKASGNQLETLKQQQADEMLLLAQREAEEKRLAREKEKRERELERKQKQQKKLELKMSLAEGITNTAVSVTKALTWGWPLGAIFAAIIGAMGAAQTAIIAKQLSKLADGGILGGRYHSDGGNPIPSMGVEVERGEAVINRKSTAKYLPLLDAINADGNGGKHTLLKTSSNIKRYAVGGVIDTNRMVNNIERNSTTQVIKESVGMIDMHPVVSVVDINRGQKNLATVRQMAGTSR